MNIVGVVIQPLDWQQNNSIARPVDPNGIVVPYTQFDTGSVENMSRLYLDFDAVQFLGYIEVEVTSGAFLYGTATIDDEWIDTILWRESQGPLVFTAGVKHDPVGEGETVYLSKLVCVGLCDKSNDDGQPAVEIIT